MVVVPSFDNSLSFRFDVVSLLKTNFKSSSSSMFEDYFRDIMSPYFVDGELEGESDIMAVQLPSISTIILSGVLLVRIAVAIVKRF